MKPQETLEPADLEWLSQQEHHWELLRVQNVKNLDDAMKQKAEAIYKKYVDPKFVLDRNCQTCNYKMMFRLLRLWEANMPEATLEGGEIVVKQETPPAGTKKPETPKK